MNRRGTHPHCRRLYGAGVLAAAVAVALAGCGTDTNGAATDTTVPGSVASAETGDAAAPGDSAPSSPDLIADTDVGTIDAASAALTQLDTLAIKGRAPKTGYSRDLFGQAWADDVRVGGGHNGCDTRNDILRRDLVDVTYKPGTRDCVVATGTLHDPYTGTEIAFVRGQDTSTAVQIDHVVALSDAWQKGAQQLDTQTRTDLANDPRNLRAVDGPTNSRKGDGDAATWLPPNKAFRCTYVADQVAVKSTYGLWVTQAEHDAIAAILGDCGGQAAAAPAPVEEPAPAPAPAPAASAPVSFANCAAARAAGAAPVHAGDPGYGTHLDRDGDGIACE